MIYTCNISFLKICKCMECR